MQTATYSQLHPTYLPYTDKRDLKKIAKILDLPIIHLDAFYHKPNWKEPKKYQWNNTNEGSSDYVYKNAKLHKTQPKQKVISDTEKTPTPQIDLIST